MDSVLVRSRRARNVMLKRSRPSVSSARTAVASERVRIVGYDEDGPVLDIPDSFVCHPKRSESGALVLPKRWAD